MSSSTGGWVIPHIVSADEFASPSFDEKDGDSDHEILSHATVKASGGFEGFDPSFCCKLEKNQFNLAGLLNVLDGVVDIPGCLVITTTNHPEMLDTDLIRPGRIDK